jgi:hypothetical protein
MDVLRQQIRRAGRRLALQRFLSLVTWHWFAALLLAAGVIGVDYFRPLGIQTWVWPLAGLGAGILTAAVWVLVTRRNELEAAIEIDRRFGLKERVSSTLALESDQLDSPAGKALVDDAVKRVSRLHVAEQFRLKLNRWALLPLVPGVAAFLLAIFLHPAVGKNALDGSTEKKEQKTVKTAINHLSKKITEQKKKASEKNLKLAEEPFAKLEAGLKRLDKDAPGDRKQALVELNDVKKELEKRREQLGGGEKLQEQLKQLKDLHQGPADKMADAMRAGDFKAARDEIKELRDKLAKGDLDEKAKAELTKQLDQMEQKLTQLAKAHDQLKQDLQKQIAEKKSKGQKKEAEELQKQLAKLQQKDAQMEQLKKMSEKLGECAKCMKQGDKAGAQAAMDAMKAQLEELSEQADEMAMLDEAMSELDEAKDAMNCKECNGEGCAACRGDRPGGMGMGKGRGKGARPEDPNKTGFYDTNVKQKLGKGAAVVTDLVDGPNVKGQVEQEVQTQFEAAKADQSDPLTGQQMPRSYREHTKKYFDSLRDGSNK